MESAAEARGKPQVADSTGAEKLVGELERLTRRVEAAAALIERLRRRLTELEEENRALLRERQEVSTRLSALIEKVDLLPDDS
jgi:predicted nuclease with TOPRIM domain